MARLTQSAPVRWNVAQTRAQFAALAQLRWCLFRNSFRRKGGIGELVARILFVPLIGIFAVLPIVFAGLAAHEIVVSRRFYLLPALTWGVFALWQVISINISQPALSFDINNILRFPLSFPRYLAARLFFGLLSASNVIGTLALLSADIGVGVARPSLLPWSTLLLSVFALANIFFTRMVFAWVDRWMSTRRAREVLAVVVLGASLGFQYLNVTFNPGLQSDHARPMSREVPLLGALHHARPLAAILPPGLAAQSLVDAAEDRIPDAIACLLGLCAFAALFLAVYAWRMQREFRGENLNQTPPAATPAMVRPIDPAAHRPPQTSAGILQRVHINQYLAACLQREFLYLRRNINQLYGIVGPVFMVLLFAGGAGSSGLGELVFPAAIAYSLLGASILTYNSLGMDGAGVQFYFFAPMRLRDVFLAKNLVSLLLHASEFALIYLILFLEGHPPTPLVAAATACWLLFATLIHAAIANQRSLAAPRAIDFSKVSRTQTSQLSALIAVAVVAACLGLGLAIVFFADYVHRPWLMIPLFVALCGVGAFFYLGRLANIDSFAQDHRETLIERLCKS